jgi:phosphatidylserine decarboxylase
MAAMNSAKTFFMSWLFPWVPKRLLSRATGLLMRFHLPKPFRAFLIRRFARAFNISIPDAEYELTHYRSLDAFFTRRLKTGIRPIEHSFVHPVDGKLTQFGRVEKGELVQAKGWTYPMGEFLGDEALAKVYEGGQYSTYYLCPADYHRVHAPVGGDLVSALHIPGLLWPVNDWSVTNIKRLFCLNERVVLNFIGEHGRWSLVMVGATNVGHITVTLDPSITTNRWMWHAPTDRQYSPPLPVKAGDELGMFHLGSTVICVYEKSFPGELSRGFVDVKMGQKAH